MVTKWMGDHYVQRFAAHPEISMEVKFCADSAKALRLKVDIAKRSRTHIRDSVVRVTLSDSSTVDYGNTKITQHALKAPVFKMLKLDTIYRKRRRRRRKLVFLTLALPQPSSTRVIPAASIFILKQAIKHVNNTS